MRFFNTSGPCDPKKHYCIKRETLVNEGINKIDNSRFFTIWAPRQGGKTTYFQFLISKMKCIRDQYFPVWISFERYKEYSLQKFYSNVAKDISDTLFFTESITSNINFSDNDGFIKLLKYFYLNYKKKLVLVIDEFEGIPPKAISEFMHGIRQIYHKRELYNIQSIILVSVSKMSKLAIDEASPFNIEEEIKVPYFTHEEVYTLIKNYEEEAGQKFEKIVKESIYKNTIGQPGLVCGICKDLVEIFQPDKTKAITINEFYQCLDYYLRKKLDKNVVNIVNKASQYKDIMLKILFGEQGQIFSLYDSSISFLYANGVIDDERGYAAVKVPLYEKVLIEYFKPKINGEIHYFPGITQDFEQYITLKGTINVHKLLEIYKLYVKRRGYKAFDTKYLKEGAWHYSLDGFIYFFVESLGGKIFTEPSSGRGKIDIIIVRGKEKHVIEVKIFRNQSSFEKGKKQLVEYLKSENLYEGYYVVFSRNHKNFPEDKLYKEEIKDGRKIYSYIIQVDFDRPSEI